MESREHSSVLGKRLPLTVAGALLTAAIMGAAVLGCSGPLRSPTNCRKWSWTDGRMIRVYDRPYEAVWRAACEAVRDYRLSVGFQDHDGLVGRIDAQRVDALPIRILVENLGRDVARVTIVVGVTGDKALSSEIVRAIDGKLAEGAKAGGPSAPPIRR